MADIIFLRGPDGAATHAVVPAALFASLGLEPESTPSAEDLADLELLRAARDDDDGFRIPLAQAKAILDGESPVKVLREWRGLAQHELAAKIGTTPNYLSQVETKARRGVRLTGKLAEALDVPEAFLKARL